MNIPNPQREPHVRRWWPRVLIVLAIGLPVMAVVLVLGTTHRPGWYQPRGVDYGRLHEDKMSLAELQERISAAVNAGDPVSFEISTEQLNRWIASRGEIWPEARADLGPLIDPQVRISDGQVQIGARAERSGWGTVVSLTVRAKVLDQVIRVRCDGVHTGAWPVPIGWLWESVQSLAAKHADWLRSPERGVVLIRNEWVWPNGRRLCRLVELELAEGKIRVTLEPVRGGNLPTQ